MAPKADRSQIRGIARTSSPGATADRQRSRRTDHPHGRKKSVMGYDRIVGALANLGHEVSDQTVGNVLRRHGIPPAPERKRRTTWAEFIRIHLAVLAGTDISAAEVLMRGLVTCYVLFFIYSESSEIDISRITNCPTSPGNYE
jgi:hypothetical protein